MAYESPIEMIMTDLRNAIQEKMIEDINRNVMETVMSYGINVNEDELRKALLYDRQQYEKGFHDGVNSIGINVIGPDKMLLGVALKKIIEACKEAKSCEECVMPDMVLP